MAISGTITLGTNTSSSISLFDLYPCTSSSSSSCSGTAFDTNVSRATLLGGFQTNNIPDGTTYIKINANSGTCKDINPAIVELTGIPVVSQTPTKTPTPTPTPPTQHYEVQICNNNVPSGTSYILNATDITPILNGYYKVNAPTIINTMDGNYCWKVVSITTANSDENGTFGTAYTNCDCGTTNPYVDYKYTYLVGSGTTADYACTFNNYWTVSGDSATFTGCTGFNKSILNDNGAPLFYAYDGHYIQLDTYNQDPIAHVGSHTFGTCTTPPDHGVVYLYSENSTADVVCGQALSEQNIRTYFVEVGQTLQNGTVIYDVWTTDYQGGLYKTKAPAGIYSNGVKYWTITGTNGILTNETTCPTISSYYITQFVPGIETESDQSDNIINGTPTCYIELNAPYSSNVTFNVTVDTTNMGTQYVEVTILANHTYGIGYGTKVGATNGALATGGCISSSTQPAISLSLHGC
jgi:hypothetical protein